MKRKLILAVLFAAFLVTNSLAAQDENNIISAGIANLGGTIGYERKLGSSISVGIGTVGSFAFEINTYDNTSWYKAFFGVEGDVKFYPFQSVFFVKAGAGYHWSWHSNKQQGFIVTPGLGCKIDIGAPGGFVLLPAVDVPLFFDKNRDSSDSMPFSVGVLVKMAVGYCF